MENSKIQIGTTQNNQGLFVEIIPNGPYVLNGNTKIVQNFIVPNHQGISVHYQEGEEFASKEKTYLCRCGLSQHKPYCDGSHKTAAENGVDLTETATFNPELLTADVISGPVVSLTDDEKLCAFARFCDNGKRIWNEVQDENQHAVDLSIEMAHHCPSGRLIVWDNNNQPIEEKTEPSIGIVEDIANDLSGPLVLWGGIPLKSGKGEDYEIRNRQTICRCGQSSNKPFCDGTHASMKFQDGLPKQPKQDGKIF
jgi:CDGSH-type Zn-finger protein